MSTEKERESYVYMAKLAEQAERYDGMCFCSLFSLPCKPSHLMWLGMSGGHGGKDGGFASCEMWLLPLFPHTKASCESVLLSLWRRMWLVVRREAFWFAYGFDSVDGWEGHVGGWVNMV